MSVLEHAVTAVRLGPAAAAGCRRRVHLDHDPDALLTAQLPTDLAGGLSGLTIVLTDKLTEVSGQVTDARGRALKDYAVVVQPSDPKPAPAMTRYLRVVRPDQDGRFRVRGLPPGAYEATAIESLEQGRQFVPDVQARLRDSSTRFTLREGETRALDLKLTPGFE